MKAIILAAGKAKRLQPLTNHTPKCLLPIGGKVILDYQIEALTVNNINDIVILVGFEAEKIKKHLLAHYPTIHFIFIENKLFEKTGPAYSFWKAKKFLDESLLYLNADVLFEKSVIKTILESTYESCTAIQRVPWDEEEVNVIVDKKNMILEIGKHISKKLSYGEFTGITKLSSSFNKKLATVLDYFVKEERLKMFAADAINLTIQKWDSNMFIVDTSHLKTIEIDTLKDYNKAKKLFL